MMEKKWWHNKVMYQIYPKSFFDSNGDGIGDLQGIIQKLDYLKELGVDILWLSPVYESPMIDQGYDISDYYNINPDFGSMADMELLIAEAKKRGFYLLMDLVINHCSSEHEWFKRAMENPEGKYGEYFYIREGKEGNPPCNWRSYFGGSAWERIEGTDRYYLHMFAKEQPDLNWENEEVRRELYKMINWWLEKGIDGFRIDAIINIKKPKEFVSYEADGEDGLCSVHKVLEDAQGIGEFLTELKRETFEKHDAFTIAEVFDDKEGELPLFIGENGYFSTMFDFTIEKARSGKAWYEDKKLYPEDIKRLIFQGQKESEAVGFRANIIENHDEPRGASSMFVKDPKCDASVKMLGTISVLLRGVPVIYQGQEIGMKNMVFTDISEVDDISSKAQYALALENGLTKEEALAVVGERTRDNARTPFQWSDEREAGFTDGAPWLKVNPNYTEINVRKQEADADSVLSYYRKLIALRKNPAYQDIFVYGTFEKAYEEAENVLAYYRKGDTGTVLVVTNYQKEPRKLRLKDTVGKVLLTNQRDVKIEDGDMYLDSFGAVVCTVEER